jgi:Spy/CpxP family protein refolding chaperone
MMPNNRLRAYLTMVLVFVLGAVVGGATAHAYDKRRLFDRFEREAPEFAQRHREKMLIRKLDLNDSQSAQLHAVFERHGAKLKELTETTLRDCSAPLQAHRDQMDAEIRSFLTPEQLTRFERMLQRRNKKLRGFGSP